MSSEAETTPVVEKPEPVEEGGESKKRPSEAIGDSEATDGAANTKRQAIENPGTGVPEATAGAVAVVAKQVVTAPEPETEIRAIITGKTAGSLIGRGGTVISFIRNESKCKVQISATIPHVEERIITVTGDVTGIFRAYSFIADKLRENEEANAERESRAPESVVLKILIPHSVAGSIIGKQGAKIREIREATKAEVTIDKQMMPGSSERACTITGTAEACAQTVFHIACTVIQVDVSGKTQYYTPGVGAGFGQGGYGGPPQPAYGHGYGGGFPPQQPQYGGHGGFQQPPQQGGYGYGAQGGGAGHAGGGAGQTSHQIPIPSDYVGAIMGRGGQKIKEIRDLSRAQVKIQDNVPGLTERVVTITGTPEAIQMAHYLIQQRMQEAMATMGGSQVP